jgi:AMP nucleosidase
LTKPVSAAVDAAIAQLHARYSAAVERLRDAVAAYVTKRTLPDPVLRGNGAFAYPELRILYDGGSHGIDRLLAYGRMDRTGTYATTITRPELFEPYLREMLTLIAEQYPVRFDVRTSTQEIPFPYVLDGATSDLLGGVSAQELSQHFPATELADIGDELADGLFLPPLDGSHPLALFDALRVDFSLARLRHYSGTPPEHFQRYILFTNYHRYVDEFVSWACDQVGQGTYTALSGAGGLYVDQPGAAASQQVADSAV